MDASIARWIRCGLILATVLVSVSTSDAANFRTRNFLIQAPNPALARAVGEAAEKYRDDLASYWTGDVLPPWPAPCPVRVVAGPNLAAQGVTTYNPAPVRDFQMEVIGTPERILDSVLPHEITHTVLATYFGRPLPRWADEGICTTVEHISERSKHEAKLREFLSSRRGIAMNQLFLLTEYPPDVLPMYAQGYSVCRFLIEQEGPQTLIAFLKDYMRRPSWTENVEKHYGYESLGELQQYWLSWVESGSGPVAQFVKADNRNRRSAGGVNAINNPARDDFANNSSASNHLAGNNSSSTNSARGNVSSVDPRSPDLESLVAANDRGRISEQSTGDSWYHRRAQGLQPRTMASDQIGLANAAGSPDAAGSPNTMDSSRASSQSSRTPSIAKSGNTDWEPLPPNTRIASRETDSQGTWAPPSVLSSGRYSAATPQGETSGSFRGDVLSPGRNQLDRGRGYGSVDRSVWR